MSASIFCRCFSIRLDERALQFGRTLVGWCGKSEKFLSPIDVTRVNAKLTACGALTRKSTVAGAMQFVYVDDMVNCGAYRC